MNTVGDAPALAVLADPTRARIVRLIREADGGRAMVSRLAEQLGLRQPTVSHHMAALHAEGLVVREPEGRRVWYSIHPDETERVAALLGTPAASAEEPDWERMVDDLAARYRGVFSRETVAGCLDDSRALLAARGPAPLFASRVAAFTASRLDDRHRVEGHRVEGHRVEGHRVEGHRVEGHRVEEHGVEEHGAEPGGERVRSAEAPTVLFVCVQNAGRSQLAAGILRQLAGDRVVVRTAGSAPAAEVRTAIVTALDEIGVPLGGEFPKPLTDEAVRAADVIVTMGCGDACPVYPGRRYLDWDLADPVGQPLGTVRAIRDDIAVRVRALLAEILPLRLPNS